MSESSSSSSSSSSASSYIRMVQHLIERCLLLHMNKDECVDALFKHAGMTPTITSTVWSELEKENNEFFEAYAKNREESVGRRKMQEDDARRRQLPGNRRNDEDHRNG